MSFSKSSKIQGVCGHLELELNSEIGRIQKFQKRRHSELAANIEGLKNEIRKLNGTNKPDVISRNYNTERRRNSLPVSYPSALSKKIVKDADVPTPAVKEARTLLKVVEKRRRSLEIEKRLYFDTLENRDRSEQLLNLNDRKGGRLRRLSVDLQLPFEFVNSVITGKNNEETRVKLPTLKTGTDGSKSGRSSSTSFEEFRNSPFSSQNNQIIRKRRLVKSFSDPDKYNLTQTDMKQISDMHETLKTPGPASENLDTKTPDSTNSAKIVDSGEETETRCKDSDTNDETLDKQDGGDKAETVGVKDESFTSFHDNPHRLLTRRASMPELASRKISIQPMSIQEENEDEDRPISAAKCPTERYTPRENITSPPAYMPTRRASITIDIDDFIPRSEKCRNGPVPGHSEKRLLMRHNSAYLLTKHLQEIKATLPTQTLLEIERLKSGENYMML